MNNLLVHTCNVQSSSVADKRIYFDNGIATFTVGKTVTGGTSKATGKILSFTKTAGSWAMGTAVGYLIMNPVTGTFQDNESLTDNNTSHGSATANGPAIDNADGYGVVTYTTGSTAYRCRFKPAGNMRMTASGDRSFSVPYVTLPPGVSVQPGTYLTSSWIGAIKTYKVLAVHPVSDGVGLHHLRCDLEEVE